jgi:hypothetical protein
LLFVVFSPAIAVSTGVFIATAVAAVLPQMPLSPQCNEEELWRFLVKTRHQDILPCVMFHWWIFLGVTVYQPDTVRCNISPGTNEACVSGTNFSNNCDTMASNEHGCVQYGKDLHPQV